MTAGHPFKRKLKMRLAIEQGAPTPMSSTSIPIVHHRDIRNLVIYCEECRISFNHRLIGDNVYFIHCPTCRGIVRPFTLTYTQEYELFHIVDALPVYEKGDDYFRTEWSTFDTLEKSLFKYTWYDDSRYIIQCCWTALLARKTYNERVRFAIRYFESAYRNFQS